MIAFVSVCLASAAHADVKKLAEARTAVDQSDYEGARSALAAALLEGTASPDELVEIYRLTGTVAGAMGDAKGATVAFEHMLALSPKAGLPPGTSPKIAKPFAAATAFFKTHEPLAARVDTAAEPVPKVTLVVASDPLSLVAKVRVTFAIDGKKEQTKDGDPSLPIELPQGARIDLRVAALDANGNRLVELGTKDVPIVIVGKTRPADPDHATPPPPDTTRVVKAPTAPSPGKREAPIYGKWWIYGGLAVVGAGVGTYFGLQARSASNDLLAIDRDSANHHFSDATSVEDRGKRDAVVANVGFGAAGILAITSAILFVRF